eukprot:COSAG02_NODE_2544_length_8566_cov_180.516712_4_plen_210_part_00
MWVPMRLCTPQHFSQRNTPILYEAHVGFRVLQSAHSWLFGSRSMSCFSRGLICALLINIEVVACWLICPGGCAPYGCPPYAPGCAIDSPTLTCNPTPRFTNYCRALARVRLPVYVTSPGNEHERARALSLSLSLSHAVRTREAETENDVGSIDRERAEAQRRGDRGITLDISLQDSTARCDTESMSHGLGVTTGLWAVGCGLRVESVAD